MSTALALSMIETGLAALLSATAREAGYAELAGEERPHEHVRARLSSLIGYAKMTHRDIGALAEHAHSWSEDDYCVLCGADGRA